VDVIARDFRVADTRRARVILIEAGSAGPAGAACRFLAHALRSLQDLGVEVRLGQPVTQVFADGVEVGGERCAVTT
jgi:NADH dehydrogenase